MQTCRRALQVRQTGNILPQFASKFLMQECPENRSANPRQKFRMVHLGSFRRRYRKGWLSWTLLCQLYIGFQPFSAIFSRCQLPARLPRLNQRFYLSSYYSTITLFGMWVYSSCWMWANCNLAVRDEERYLLVSSWGYAKDVCGKLSRNHSCKDFWRAGAGLWVMSVNNAAMDRVSDVRVSAWSGLYILWPCC